MEACHHSSHRKPWIKWALGMKDTASNLVGNINALVWAEKVIINQAVVLWRHLLCQMSQNCVPTTVLQSQKHCKGGRRKRVWQLNITKWLWSHKGIHYRATENLPSNNSRQNKQQQVSIAPVAIICAPCYAMVCRYLVKCQSSGFYKGPFVSMKSLSNGLPSTIGSKL